MLLGEESLTAETVLPLLADILLLLAELLLALVAGAVLADLVMSVLLILRAVLSEG